MLKFQGVKLSQAGTASAHSHGHLSVGLDDLRECTDRVQATVASCLKRVGTKPGVQDLATSSYNYPVDRESPCVRTRGPVSSRHKLASQSCALRSIHGSRSGIGYSIEQNSVYIPCTRRRPPGKGQRRLQITALS